MAVGSKAIDYAVRVSPHPKFQAVSCGDYGLVKDCGDTLFLALVDALGHGPEAAKVVDVARPFLASCDSNDLVLTMTALHEHLRGTLGAVVGLASLNIATGDLRYAGIGNITARVYGSQYVHFVPRSGIVGYAMPEARANLFGLLKGDVLVMHSDGLPEHLDLRKYPKMLTGNASDLAAQLVERFSKSTDDSSCIVAIYDR